MSQTITKEEVSEEVQKISDYPYTLLLHNDDYNTFEWVIECLMKVCKHEYEQANQCAHLIHFKGKCDVKRGEEVVIKTMYEKLKSAKLTVTMEKN